jgi:hypothetical protein
MSSPERHCAASRQQNECGFPDIHSHHLSHVAILVGNIVIKTVHLKHYSVIVIITAAYQCAMKLSDGLTTLDESSIHSMLTIEKCRFPMRFGDGKQSWT